jgi:hypothetical protein
VALDYCAAPGLVSIGRIPAKEIANQDGAYPQTIKIELRMLAHSPALGQRENLAITAIYAHLYSLSVAIEDLGGFLNNLNLYVKNLLQHNGNFYNSF